jgi:hypothetical protein
MRQGEETASVLKREEHLWWSEYLKPVTGISL